MSLRLPYVVSEDIGLLLGPLSEQLHLTHPSNAFLNELRDEMAKELQRVFPENDIVFVGENDLQKGMNFLAKSRPDANLATVSLDRVYFEGDPLLTLDTTRLLNPDTNERVLGSRTTEPLDSQFHRIFQTLKDRGLAKVQLVDDVLFSSGGIREIIKRFHDAAFRVTHVVSGVTIGKGKRGLWSAFPGIEIDSVFEYDEVVDEICERDFYLGIPFSGSLIGKNGVSFPQEIGASYLLPCGNVGDVYDWASIPLSHEKGWSTFCVQQSIKLWKEVERLSGRRVHCHELPRQPRNMPWTGSVVECMEQLLPPSER